MTVVTHPQLPALRFPKRSTVIAAAVAGLAVAGIAAFAGTGNPTIGVDSVVSTDTGINSSVAVPSQRHPSDISGAAGSGVTVNPVIAQEMLAAQAQQYGLSGLSPASMAPVGAAAGSGVAVNPATAQVMLAAQDGFVAAPVGGVPQTVQTGATPSEAARNTQHFLAINDAAPAIAADTSALLDGQAFATAIEQAFSSATFAASVNEVLGVTASPQTVDVETGFLDPSSYGSEMDWDVYGD